MSEQISKIKQIREIYLKNVYDIFKINKSKKFNDINNIIKNIEILTNLYGNNIKKFKLINLTNDLNVKTN